jgi:hypothetical protein
MRLPDLRRLPAFAKAQAWGLAVGFALAWLTVDRLHLNFWAMILGLFASWIAWEFLLARSAPSARTDIRAMAYGIATGFAFPWLGVALAAVLNALRP